MVSQPYDGITDKVSHRIASGLTVGPIAADRARSASWWSVPACWFPGDAAVVTSRDGRVSADEAGGMDVCAGELTVGLPGN